MYVYSKIFYCVAINMTSYSPIEDAQKHDVTTIADTNIEQRLHQMAIKIEVVSRHSGEIKNELGAIKTRLFNGIADTTRETYAKVLILEDKQEKIDDHISNIQHKWIQKFSVHDSRDAVYHAVFGIILVILASISTVVASIQGWECVVDAGHQEKTTKTPAETGEEKGQGYIYIGP